MANFPGKLTTLGKVHSDMERYLAEDCYCPGEIYDVSGFFYILYTVNDPCIIVNSNKDRTAVIARPDDDKPQVIMFWHDELSEPEKIIEAQRADATENNIALMRDFVDSGTSSRKLDEFVPGETKRSLESILDLSNGLIIS